MLTLGNSIDYLSIQGIPWVLGAWVGLILLRPFATFVHEVGHIIPALLFTKQDVFIRVGQNGSKWNGKVGNILWEFNIMNGNEGFSGYDKASLNKVSLFIVISGGLLSSFSMACVTGWQIFGNHHAIWIEVFLVSWFCANALVFIRSVIPLRLKPTKSFPEGPPSDGLELKNLFFK